MSEPPPTADALKGDGNAAFARGDFSAAVRLYTAALAVAPPDAAARAVLLSNRSAAYLARGGGGDALAALSDASAAVREHPPFAKGYGRKAAALLALGQGEEATAAFAAGLRQDPTNAALRQGLVTAQAALAAERTAAVAPSVTAVVPPSAGSGAGGGDAGAEADPLASFLSEMGDLTSTIEERARAAQNVHAPISEARGAISKAEAMAASLACGGPRALMDGVAGAPGPLITSTTLMLDRWAAAAAAGDAEAEAERARLEAEAIAAVSSGREYELEGDAALAQSAAIAATDLGSGDAAVTRLVLAPHAEWINLNAFDVLKLPHTCNEDDIKHRYRKLSALVHPDKCSHERAGDAFQVVKAAYDALLEPNKRRLAAGTIHATIRGVTRDRRLKETKLRASGQFAALAALPPIDEDIVIETRRAFAQVEHRKRSYEARVKLVAAREAEAAVAAHEAEVEAAKADQLWAAGRDKRKGDWHAFEHAINAGGGSGPGGGAKKRRVVNALSGVGVGDADDDGEEEEEGLDGLGGVDDALGGDDAALAGGVAASVSGPLQAGALRVSAALRYGAAAVGQRVTGAAGVGGAAGAAAAAAGAAPPGGVSLDEGLHKKRWR